jgi:hypothetical protein
MAARIDKIVISELAATDPQNQSLVIRIRRGYNKRWLKTKRSTKKGIC